MIKLTANFKLDGDSSRVEPLFPTFIDMVNELLEFAHKNHITSFKRLRISKYYEFRRKFPDLPSHYIYTACQMACSIYRAFRKLKRRGRAKDGKPVFRKSTIMLDDHLFSLDLRSWIATIATPQGRVKFRLLHGQCHEKFETMKLGQGWLVKRGHELWLKVVFRKVVELREPNGRALAIDVNENNVTIAFPNGFKQIITRERPIRTAYFLKRRRVQSAIKYGKRKQRLLAKYRGREKRRVEDIYHKVANQIIEQALNEDISTIILEKLTHIRRKIHYTRSTNGRLHRWSFRRLQTVIEYKAKLAGINVVYEDAYKTSSLCPICGEELSLNGYRELKCRKCGLVADRDVIGAWNLLKRHVGSSVPPERLQMKALMPDGGRPTKKVMEVNGRSERLSYLSFLP
ncbi:MAG: transposase [Thaumarchaeota archaeon]|nr:MAG: transposase [Nitrososphaerota archaeon]